MSVDKATNNGEIDQPPLALHARKPASEKRDQEKGEERARIKLTNERSVRTGQTKGRQKRMTHHRKQSKTRPHTPSPTLRLTLRLIDVAFITS